MTLILWRVNRVLYHSLRKEVKNGGFLRVKSGLTEAPWSRFLPVAWGGIGQCNGCCGSFLELFSLHGECHRVVLGHCSEKRSLRISEYRDLKCFLST